MGKEELIACFQNTLDLSKSGVLRKKTIKAIKTNKVYKEGFVAKVPKGRNQASIIVQAGTTFEAAKQYYKLGKVAVLNFANPEYPGGGVYLGAMAQEECLCRSSNLYLCISDANVFDDYYLYHRELWNHFYTDRLIYTKNVTVFKDDSLVPKLLPEKDWFKIDVITCAAPYIAKQKYTNSMVLLSLFKKRIKNIFEAARDNKVDVIILGAFGCGAFKNPPDVVSNAFYEVIIENEYNKCFQKIVFAIKSTNNDNPFEPCPNIFAFENTFQWKTMDSGLNIHIMTSEFGKLRWTDNFSLAQAVGSVELPSGRVLKGGKEFNPYYKWRNKNKYFGKQFSILGDSISTLEGFNPENYKVFYFGETCRRTDVSEMKDTWWGKVIEFFGGELLVNNSWSGSKVTKLPQSELLFPSGCSDERTSALHINDVMPDVILVYLGTNDWAFGAKTGNETRFLGVDDHEYFDEAYNNMLKKLKANYPESEIWCCTLCETYISKRPDFKFPHKYAGTHIEEYNEIIRNVVRNTNCKLIDLYNFKMAYDSIDGSHPTQFGMNTIATMVIRGIAGSDADQFLDCEEGQHEYRVVEEYAGGTRQVCSRCGKTIRKRNWFLRKRERPHSPKFMQNKTAHHSDVEKQPEDKYHGKMIDQKYEILRQIKRDDFYATYLVRNVRVNKIWEMKICDKKSHHYSPVIRDIIFRELHMTTKLNHPAIPKVVDVIEDEEGIFIVGDYIEGETLETIVARDGAQPVNKVIEWSKQLCAALAYLHSLTPPLIYRDMRPKNVMLMSDGNLKLIDFSVMMPYDSQNLLEETPIESVGYAAPEQYNGQSKPQTDIFGLGMTMYRLVTGLEPGQTLHESKTNCQINAELPKQLEYIIAKCTQLHPDDRYQSCKELMEDLHKNKEQET